MQLNDVLPKVLQGVWRTSEEAKAADAKRIEQNQRVARELTPTSPIYAKLRAALWAKDWTTALSAVQEGLVLMPDEIDLREIHVNLLLHKIRDLRAGLPVMRQLVRDAIDKGSEELMTVALTQLFDPANDASHLPLAERFAMGRDLAEHILWLNPPQADGYKFRSYGAIAEYYYESGNKERAIELIELALTSLSDSKLIQEEERQYYVRPLIQALAKYSTEKALEALLFGSASPPKLRASIQTRENDA